MLHKHSAVLLVEDQCKERGKWALCPLPPSDSLGSLVPPLPMAHGQIRTGSLEKAHHSSGAKG